MKKDKIKGFISGLIVASTVFALSVTAFAATGNKTIQVAYDNMKIYINEKLTPMVTDGHVVEPFTYQGRTYVPLNAVATALGQKVSWDENTKSIYIGSQPSKPNSAADAKGHMLPEIVESGFGTSPSGNKFYVNYGITIKNPNKDVAIEYPSFRIVARDENGALLGTDDQTLAIIYPGDSVTFASQAFSTDKIPATVSFEILKPAKYNWIPLAALDHKKYIPLQIKEATRTSDSIVGEIVNTNDYDIKSANVSIVFRDNDGKIIGGQCTFVNDVSASGKTPFKDSVRSIDKSKNFSVYAMPW